MVAVLPMADGDFVVQSIKDSLRFSLQASHYGECAGVIKRIVDNSINSDLISLS